MTSVSCRLSNANNDIFVGRSSLLQKIRKLLTASYFKLIKAILDLRVLLTFCFLNFLLYSAKCMDSEYFADYGNPIFVRFFSLKKGISLPTLWFLLQRSIWKHMKHSYDYIRNWQNVLFLQYKRKNKTKWQTSNSFQKCICILIMFTFRT